MFVKKVFVNLLLLVGALVLCAVGGEIVTRLLDRDIAPEAIVNAQMRPVIDPDKPIYYLRPGAVINSDGGNPNATAHINSIGYRGDEFVKEKSEGTFRVVCLGDSFTYGHGVNQDEMYPAQLEALLNGSGDPRRFQVYNFGVGGYNTEQEWITLRDRAGDYDPDMVTLQYVLDDTTLSRVVLDGTRFVRDRSVNVIHFEEEPVPVSIPLPEFLSMPLLRHSHFYRFLSRRVYVLRKKWSESPGRAQWRAGHDNCKESIRKIRDASAKRGIPFLLLIFPPINKNFEDHIRGENLKWIVETAETLGVAHIDFGKIFTAPDAMRFQNCPRGECDPGGHYNADGYGVVVKKIVAKMSEMGVIVQD